jgi:hypothetical protein
MGTYYLKTEAEPVFRMPEISLFKQQAMFTVKLLQGMLTILIQVYFIRFEIRFCLCVKEAADINGIIVKLAVSYFYVEISVQALS